MKMELRSLISPSRAASYVAATWLTIALVVLIAPFLAGVAAVVVPALLIVGLGASLEVALFWPPLPQNIDVKELSIWNGFERRCFGGEGRGEGAEAELTSPSPYPSPPRTRTDVYFAIRAGLSEFLGERGPEKRNFKRRKRALQSVGADDHALRGKAG